MKALLLSLAAVFPICSASAAPAEKPIYENNFENAEVGKLPEDFLVLSGSFTVQPEGDGKVLELPGAPLDTFGLLFGPAEKDGLSATARFFGTRQGRKFPAFGVSLNGVGGYRLQVSPGKKAIEIYKGDTVLTSLPHEWNSGSWTRLRVQVRKGPAGSWLVEGKAWPADGPEPKEWTITFEEKEEPSPGRAGIWGSPYSGTPIRFDDLLVTRAQP